MFLRTLGVDGDDIPYETAERAARFRTLVAGRRILVILDNARTVEDVRMLLPGGPPCAAVVTSRDSLVALVARHGAQRVDLDLLPPGDALALLRALIGRRVDDEPDAAATLAAQCARLPIALRIAAERAAISSEVPLSHLVDELADEQRRLDLMDAGGDPRTAVRPVFSWSYRHLPADAARAFRLLGLQPSIDHDAYAIAALTGTAVGECRYLLDLLARAHLINRTVNDRYGMHDLLRAYAAGLATEQDATADRRAAQTRLFDHYLATAAGAMDTLHPAEKHDRPEVPRNDWANPAVAEPAQALDWLDTERPNLVAVCVYTAAHGWPERTIKLASTLFRYLDLGSHYAEALIIHNHARQAAAYIDDRAAEAHALTSVGLVHRRHGRLNEAEDHFRESLSHFRDISDRSGEARVLVNLGLVDWRQGRHAQAADHLRQALALNRLNGDRSGEARALDFLGIVYGQQSRHVQAADHLRLALAIHRDMGNRAAEAATLGNLGDVCRRQGLYDQAADHLQQALARHRELGNLAGEADALNNLGLVYGIQGQHDQAADHVRQALTIYRDVGDRVGEADVLNSLGEITRAAGQPDQARAHHLAALTLATATGDRNEQARANSGVAHSYRDTGEHDQARHHWLQALAGYTELDVPEADDIRKHLAAVDEER